MLTKEDLEYRKTRIGASDCPIIMGESPYKTPRELWQDKLSKAVFDEPNENMKKGNEMEPLIRGRFEDIVGIPFEPARRESLNWNIMMATLDGISPCGEVFIEIKYNNRENHALAKAEKLPAMHFWQMQHQWSIMREYGAKQAWYVSCHGDDIVYFNIHPNYDRIGDLLTEEKRWWQYVENQVAPPMTERDYVDIKDEKYLMMARGLNTVRQKMKELEEEEKSLLSELRKAGGSRNAKFGDHTLTRIIRKGTIDYGSIPELRSVDIERYRKADIETWRFN